MRLKDGRDAPPGTYVIMTRPAGPDSDFVEVETHRGTGVAVRWWEREDGTWALGPFEVLDENGGASPPSGPVIYFGCGPDGSLGHHFFPSGSGRPLANEVYRQRIAWAGVDGQLAPRLRDDGLVRFGNGGGEEAPQGVAWLHHRGGQTALAYWDRSVDRRPYSNSVFFLQGTLTFDQAIDAARSSFPWVFDRQEFEVVACLSPAAPAKEASGR